MINLFGIDLTAQYASPLMTKVQKVIVKMQEQGIYTLTNPNFEYVSAANTDIRKTFERVKNKIDDLTLEGWR